MIFNQKPIQTGFLER